MYKCQNLSTLTNHGHYNVIFSSFLSYAIRDMFLEKTSRSEFLRQSCEDVDAQLEQYHLPNQSPVVLIFMATNKISTSVLW